MGLLPNRCAGVARRRAQAALRRSSQLQRRPDLQRPNDERRGLVESQSDLTGHRGDELDERCGRADD